MKHLKFALGLVCSFKTSQAMTPSGWIYESKVAQLWCLTRLPGERWIRPAVHPARPVAASANQFVIGMPPNRPEAPSGWASEEESIASPSDSRVVQNSYTSVIVNAVPVVRALTAATRAVRVVTGAHRPSRGTSEERGEISRNAIGRPADPDPLPIGRPEDFVIGVTLDELSQKIVEVIQFAAQQGIDLDQLNDQNRLDMQQIGVGFISTINKVKRDYLNHFNDLVQYCASSPVTCELHRLAFAEHKQELSSKISDKIEFFKRTSTDLVSPNSGRDFSTPQVDAYLSSVLDKMVEALTEIGNKLQEKFDNKMSEQFPELLSPPKPMLRWHEGRTLSGA